MKEDCHLYGMAIAKLFEISDLKNKRIIDVFLKEQRKYKEFVKSLLKNG